MFFPNFLKFTRKIFLRQAFSLQIFCSCWYILFTSTILPQTWNRKFSTWNGILNNPTEKRLHYVVQVHRQKPWLLTTLSISFIGLRFGFPFTFQLLLSARNLTPSWGNIWNKLYGKMYSSKHRTPN